MRTPSPEVVRPVTAVLLPGFLGLAPAGLTSWVLLGRRSHARRGPFT